VGVLSGKIEKLNFQRILRTDAHTALLRRALSGLLFVTLLAARQEVSKKRAKGCAFGNCWHPTAVVEPSGF
jgi:hypothetical protein